MAALHQWVGGSLQACFEAWRWWVAIVTLWHGVLLMMMIMMMVVVVVVVVGAMVVAGGGAERTWMRLWWL